FPSPQQLRIEQWRQQINEGKKLTPHNPYRFWFESGQFSYQASEDAATVFLDRAQVVLNDEDQKIATAGLVASGNIDPLTRGFACSWTDRMEDVYNAEPIWRELHNMFRHFALTRILKDCDAFTQAEFDSAFLLD